MSRAIVMKRKDNVATVVEVIEQGSDVYFLLEHDKVNIKVTDIIPSGHKFAIRDVAAGERVIKYGETIGIATKDIKIGEHVHIHNVDSCRGRGDK